MKPPPFSTTPEAVAAATAAALAAGKGVIYVPARLRPVMAVARHLPHRVFAKIDR